MNEFIDYCLCAKKSFLTSSNPIDFLQEMKIWGQLLGKIQ